MNSYYKEFSLNEGGILYLEKHNGKIELVKDDTSGYTRIELTRDELCAIRDAINESLHEGY